MYWNGHILWIKIIYDYNKMPLERVQTSPETIKKFDKLIKLFKEDNGLMRRSARNKFTPHA